MQHNLGTERFATHRPHLTSLRGSRFCRACIYFGCALRVLFPAPQVSFNSRDCRACAIPRVSQLGCLASSSPSARPPPPSNCHLLPADCPSSSPSFRRFRTTSSPAFTLLGGDLLPCWAGTSSCWVGTSPPAGQGPPPPCLATLLPLSAVTSLVGAFVREEVPQKA